MYKKSKAEEILLIEMNKLGLYPKTQHTISKHHVDFAFPESKFIIEVDGPYHRTINQQRIDEKRRDIAEREGWQVKRFPAEDVYENPGEIAKKIKWMMSRNNNRKLSYFDKRKETPEQKIILHTNIKEIEGLEKRLSKTETISDGELKNEIIRERIKIDIRIISVLFIGLLLFVHIMMSAFILTNSNKQITLKNSAKNSLQESTSYHFFSQIKIGMNALEFGSLVHNSVFTIQSYPDKTGNELNLNLPGENERIIVKFTSDFYKPIEENTYKYNEDAKIIKAELYSEKTLLKVVE